jgi:hypothetical protein
MDTKTLITEAKARFNHNSAKTYLKEKYESKLIVADQLGLWSANPTTINFLTSSTEDEIILIDNFNNPVKIKRKLLLSKLNAVYKSTMEEWYTEWAALEKKR